jgi:chloramphenicol O-acetyltransferase type A
MNNSLEDGRQKIDPQTWERAATFNFFRAFTEPFHGVCLRVDCTATYRYAKDHGLSVFLSLVHRALAAAQQVENFRTRIVDGEVWLYQQIHGGSTVDRPNGLSGSATIAFFRVWMFSCTRLRLKWSAFGNGTILNATRRKT